MSVRLKCGYRPAEAADFLGSSELLERMKAAGWIKPVVNEHKLVIYDGSALAKCWARVCGGELPPERPRKTPRKREVAHA